MSAPPVAQASTTPSPGRTPAAARAVLAACGDQPTLDLFDRALDAAYIETITTGSPDPMRAVVDRWGQIATMAATELPLDHPYGGRGRQETIAAWESTNGESLG